MAFGGVPLSTDNDQVSAPVATVGYSYQVTASVTARSGPASSYAAAGTLAAGSAVAVSCQAAGRKAGTSSVWDKLSNGRYVADYYVSTPSSTGYSTPLPRCMYPFQVTPAGGLSVRSGPGTSHPVTGNLAEGALARVVCQRASSRVGTSPVWDKLTN